MELSPKILKDYNAISQFAANVIFDFIKTKPNAVIALATGNSPVQTYANLVSKIILEKPDISECTFVGLDEWIGIPPSNSGSCHAFLFHHIFEPLEIGKEQVHLFNAMSDDLEQECSKMNSLISTKDGIDLMVAGVGMNGHIGFNEPGVEWNLHSHVVNLDNTTKTVGQKYFDKITNLTQGITLGMKHLLESRHVLLLASGLNKAEIIRRVLEGDVCNAVPASIIRRHPHATVVLDADAASKLTVRRI